jgi:hypothetical protein
MILHFPFPGMTSDPREGNVFETLVCECSRRTDYKGKKWK